MVLGLHATSSFQNTSTPAPSSSVWDFGDGNSSNSLNPVKIYSTVGVYTVKLTNTYSYCTDSFSKSIKILARPVANFSVNDSFKCQPNLTSSFQDLSTNAVSWQWNFGDGGTSTQQNPTHTYTGFGTFTVQLVVTNASGCTDTITRTNHIKIIKPTINFANMPAKGCVPYTITGAANITTLDLVTSYSWNFGDGTPNSNLPNPTHTYPVQGTYTVTLTITTSTGCTETYTLPGAVRVGRRPSINFNAVPNPACAYQDVHFTDLTNEGDEWLWFFGDGVTSSLQNPVHFYSDTGWMNVKLVVSNNGCTDSLRLDSFIRIKPPIAKFGFVPNCTDRLLFNFVDSSIGATSWYWNFGDGTFSTQQNPIHTFPGYNTYNVSLTVSNDTCSHTITKAIRVFDENPDFSANVTVACRPRTINYSAIVSNVANIVEYLWDFGDGTTWNSNVFNSGGSAYHFYFNSGYYTIRLITTDIYGCKDTITKINYIRINGPLASFNATNTAGCKGLTTTFVDLSQGDGISNIVSWQWHFGDGTVQNFSGPPFQHTYVNAGTYSVKLVVTDAGGCVDSVTSLNLITATSPQANFYTSDSLGCPGTYSYFNNTTVALGYTSSWYFGDGGTSTVNSPNYQYLNTGLYTVKLVITDQYGCSDSLTRPNYVKIAMPVASFTVNDSISSCTPFEVQFTNTSTYWNHLGWSLGGGFSTVETPIQFYTVPGVYQVFLVAHSPGGCRDTAWSTITVYDTAGANVSYLPLNGCKPLNINISAFSPGPMDSYTWDFGDGTLVSTTANNTNHTYNFFGNFTPKVILTDPAGCLIPVNGLDTIRIKGATVNFGFDKKFYCDSGWVNFTDSTLYNDSLSVYNWDFGDGATSNIQNPSHHYTTPGLYSVTLNVETQNACVDTLRLNNVVKIVESPLVKIDGDSIICVNDSLLHFGVFQRPDTSVVKWAWQFPNGNSSALQNPIAQQYKTAGNFVVTTVATNSSGCKDTARQNIKVNPLPTVSLPTTITKQAGFPVTLPANYSSGVLNWNWNPAQTLDCQTCPKPIADPKFNTLYTVSFVDSNGCKNTGFVQVIVICKDANVFVPNTFSPNNDGSNDVFYVRGKGLDRVKSIRVFNRWGEVVFEQQNFPVNNPAYGWNGTYKGHKPIPDVYVYQVEVFCENSQLIRFEGNIALIQ